MTTNPDCSCTPLIPEPCPVCTSSTFGAAAEMPPNTSLETELRDQIDDLLAALEELERETSHAHVSVGGIQSNCAVCRAIKRARATLAEVKGV